MRITVSTPTAGTVVLGDDVDIYTVAGPSGMTFSGVNQEQSVALLRGDEMQFLDRGNRQTNFSFNVTRKHANTKDAEYFLIQHERDLPRRGLITLTARHSSGGEVSAYIAGAMITPQSTYLGITTRHSYQIHGGRLLVSPPA